MTASYTRAAQEVGGTLVAVGEGWRAAWRRDPSLPLYGPDDFHPSPAGTYLAALMFVERLTGVSPVGLPGPETSSSPALRQVRVDAARLRILQEAAAEAGVPAIAGVDAAGRPSHARRPHSGAELQRDTGRE